MVVVIAKHPPAESPTRSIFSPVVPETKKTKKENEMKYIKQI